MKKMYLLLKDLKDFNKQRHIIHIIKMPIILKLTYTFNADIITHKN